MRFSLSIEDSQEIVDRLKASNELLQQQYPGDRTDRQAIHTVYGGAHLFKAGSAKKLGGIALRNLKQYAPNFCQFARILSLPYADALPKKRDEVDALTERFQAAEADGCSYVMEKSHPSAWLAYTLYQRVLNKLKTQAIEDNRIDFEDGYGNRPDEEEDQHAFQAANEVADGMNAKSLPPFIGIRIKPFTEESRERGFRTLDLFLTQLAERTGGLLPNNFVVTLPKVTHTAQVSALADLLDLHEEKGRFSENSIAIEIMVETPQCIIDQQGDNALQRLIAAGRGRCRSVHFGTYDYTANLNITAAHQTHTHTACDFARSAMQVAVAGTGVNMSDGATTLMPIAPHRAAPDKPLTSEQIIENQQIVEHAWKVHYDNILHSLKNGIYQGWDLNPAQLPIRYAAVYSFFLMGLKDASHRLHQFLNKAAQATLSGNTFDDAATGQGLLNYYLRGIACGALTEEEALTTGITMDELRSRSFVKIVANRTKDV